MNVIVIFKHNTERLASFCARIADTDLATIQYQAKKFELHATYNMVDFSIIDANDSNILLAEGTIMLSEIKCL